MKDQGDVLLFGVRVLSILRKFDDNDEGNKSTLEVFITFVEECSVSPFCSFEMFSP